MTNPEIRMLFTHRLLPACQHRLHGKEKVTVLFNKGNLHADERWQLFHTDDTLLRNTLAVRERKYKTTFKSTGILLGLLFKQFLGKICCRNMLYSDLADEHYLALRKPVFNNLEDN